MGHCQCVSLHYRDKEHSTIIYEAGESDTALLRLGWNKQDPRYMATLIMDTCKVSRCHPLGCQGWDRGSSPDPVATYSISCSLQGVKIRVWAVLQTLLYSVMHYPAMHLSRAFVNKSEPAHEVFSLFVMLTDTPFCVI